MSNILKGNSLHDAPIRVIFWDQDMDHFIKYARVANSISTYCGGGAFFVEILHFCYAEQILKTLDQDREYPTVIIADESLIDFENEDIVSRIRNRDADCKLILFSNDSDHALHGYRVGADAYLLKDDTDMKEFVKVLLHATTNALEQTNRYITFLCGGYFETMLLTDIHYFKVARKICTVFHDDKAFDFYSSLEQVEKALAAHGFMRVHRKYVISLSKVQRHNKDELTMVNGKVIPIGDKYKDMMSETMHEMSALLA
jgi:DNA-binding LytR/AlgR family response regulator